MKKVIECIPNFSEGRDRDKIEAIVAEIEKVEGVEIWDILSDKDHNRTVVTFVGGPDQVKKAAVNSAIKAAELIDMSLHRGEHPRIGATDVIPFVPLVNSDMDECIQLAEEVGEILSEKLNLPVYLYGEAARRSHMIGLGEIQNIQYENLIDKIKEDRYRPDFGPDKLSKKLGGSIIGARSPLVAFNVNLGTDDILIARAIARSVRESGHGLKNVKAMGVELKEQGIVQVSMDMVNYKETPLYKAFEMIKVEAERYGVPVVGSELIGLVPNDAILESFNYYFRLHDFDKKQIIENRL